MISSAEDLIRFHNGLSKNDLVSLENWALMNSRQALTDGSADRIHAWMGVEHKRRRRALRREVRVRGGRKLLFDSCSGRAFRACRARQHRGQGQHRGVSLSGSLTWPVRWPDSADRGRWLPATGWLSCPAMSERILVTGATGAVGCELVRLLVEAGAEVKAGTRNPAKALRTLRSQRRDRRARLRRARHFRRRGGVGRSDVSPTTPV